jgi:hypothetical protein
VPQGRSGRVRKIGPTGNRSPDVPTRSELLYRLRCPAFSATRIRIVNCLGGNTRGKFHQWYRGTACKGMRLVVLRVSLYLSVLFLLMWSLRIQCLLLFQCGYKVKLPSCRFVLSFTHHVEISLCREPQKGRYCIIPHCQ